MLSTIESKLELPRLPTKKYEGAEREAELRRQIALTDYFMLLLAAVAVVLLARV